MLIKRVTNHIYDCFSDNIGNHSTGFAADLWVRIFVRNNKVEFLKGNKTLLKQAAASL